MPLLQQVGSPAARESARESSLPSSSPRRSVASSTVSRIFSFQQIQIRVNVDEAIMLTLSAKLV